jgi:hypothetical protein
MMRATRNPRWANAERTVIDCEIEHERLGWLPFSASAADGEQDGRNLFAELSKGRVAPFVPPAPVTPAPAPSPLAVQFDAFMAFVDVLAEAGIIDANRVTAAKARLRQKAGL